MSNLKFRYKLIFSAIAITLISILAFSVMHDTDNQNEIADDGMALSINILPQHTLTYNANGGYFTYQSAYMKPTYSTTSDVLHYILIDDGRAIHKEGYTFNGWNTRSDGLGETYTVGSKFNYNKDLTLYAQWKPNLCTIWFNLNGGNGKVVSMMTGYTGTAITLPTDDTFSKEGYTFKGWGEKADGNYSSTLGGGAYWIKKDATLYAQWDANHYKVTLDTKGGSRVTGGSFTYSWATAEYGSGVTLPSTEPTKSGYIFKGWNTKEDGSGTNYKAGSVYTIGASDSKLYAQWELSVTNAIDSLGNEGKSMLYVTVALIAIAIAIGLIYYGLQKKKKKVVGTVYSASSRFCSNCGKKADDGDVFCKSCGSPLDNRKSNP